MIGVDAFPDRVLPDFEPHFEVRKGNADSIPLDDSSVGLAICRFLLGYLPDPQRCVDEIHRILEPGGCALLQDLDGQLLWHHPTPSSFAEELAIVRSA